jgi:hypothetical protein
MIPFFSVHPYSWLILQVKRSCFDVTLNAHFTKLLFSYLLRLRLKGVHGGVCGELAGPPRLSPTFCSTARPPLHPTQLPTVCNEPFPSERDSSGAMRHACGRSIAATEPLRLCGAHHSTTLNYRTRASSNTSADPTMLSSLAAATQAAKPLPQQLDPAHEQPS